MSNVPKRYKILKVETPSSSHTILLPGESVIEFLGIYPEEIITDVDRDLCNRCPLHH